MTVGTLAPCPRCNSPRWETILHVCWTEPSVANPTTPLGWQCPVCRAIWAPTVEQCKNQATATVSVMGSTLSYEKPCEKCQGQDEAGTYPLIAPSGEQTGVWRRIPTDVRIGEMTMICGDGVQWKPEYFDAAMNERQ